MTTGCLGAFLHILEFSNVPFFDKAGDLLFRAANNVFNLSHGHDAMLF